MSTNTGYDTTQSFQQAETSAPIDYFGFQSTDKWYFPDKIQHMVLNVMNEGQKLKFQKNTSRDLIMEKGTGNARMKMDPGTERHELIRACVVDWVLYRNAQPVIFSDRNLRDFLDLADPRLIESLEQKIRSLNPWLLNDMTVEQIDEEIERLEQMKRDVQEREAGNDSSSSR